MSCINTSLCIVKTESTQTEGVELRLIKERITVGVTDTDKATVKSEHKPSERSCWIHGGKVWMSMAGEKTHLRLPLRAGHTVVG